MADQLQLRGGTTAEHATFTGAQREVTVDTDKDVVVVHDGVTAGGFPMANTNSVNNTTTYFNDDTGAGSVANAYVLSPKTNSRVPTSYTDGLQLGFVTTNANTGASTVNFTGLGVKNVKLAGGGDPTAAQLDGRVNLVYDLANDWFELQIEEVQMEQLKSVSATAALNILTVGLNSGSVDYRSSTVSNGTPTTVNNSPITLAVPSGATLGTADGVESRIMILAINAAGTTELAVANAGGTTNFDETGLLTTVAIDTNSDSANTVYSAVARAGVPFRVVGFVESTQATAGAWIAAPTLVQPAGGQSVTGSGLGYGQAWQDLTSSRSVNVVYTNTTGRAISVAISEFNPDTDAHGIKIDGSLIYKGNLSTSNWLTFLVPAGSTYEASATSTAFTLWSELR